MLLFSAAERYHYFLCLRPQLKKVHKRDFLTHAAIIHHLEHESAHSSYHKLIINVSFEFSLERESKWMPKCALKLSHEHPSATGCLGDVKQICTRAD